MQKKIFLILLVLITMFSFGCASIYNYSPIAIGANHSEVTAFRFRTDLSVDIDDNFGWGGETNKSPSQIADTPFRVRFEVESARSESDSYLQFALQYRWNNADWQFAEAQHFPYPSAASPPLSIIGCKNTFLGEEADNLLTVSSLPHDFDASICLAPTTPIWEPSAMSGKSAEFEWTLVARYWADGPQQLCDGDTFTLRMVDQFGQPLSGPQPKFKVTVPPKHIGGTFVETPNRVGPYETDNGDLYFIMEPTETGNVFMMIKSVDGGNSWFETDGINRPKTDDLEGVASTMSTDGVIHIVHQTSDATYHHAFATANTENTADRWMIKDSIIEEIIEPDVQTADIAKRADGSLVAFYANGSALHFSIGNPDGTWLPPVVIEDHGDLGLTNPVLLAKPDGNTVMAYKTSDGNGWARHLTTDNMLSEPELFAKDLGTDTSESMAILPLAYVPNLDKTVFCFRQADGTLHCKTKSAGTRWSEVVQMSEIRVVTNAVDSEQAGADVLVHDNKIYVSFIDQEKRDIYLSRVDIDLIELPVTEKLISDIDAAWVRTSVLFYQTELPVIGMIYDAGSEGGSGFNRFHLIEIPQK